MDVPACGRGSSSRHAAMACSGMDVASMASGPYAIAATLSQGVAPSTRREGKARDAGIHQNRRPRAPRAPRRGRSGAAPPRRWTRAPRRRPPAGPRGPSGARRPSGRARAAPRRPSPPSPASRRRPRSSSTPSAGRGRRRHTKPRRSAPSSCARGRARRRGRGGPRAPPLHFRVAPRARPAPTKAPNPKRARLWTRRRARRTPSANLGAGGRGPRRRRPRGPARASGTDASRSRAGRTMRPP